MKSILLSSLVLLATVPSSFAQPPELARRLQEQERQIKQLELENSRLRWLIQYHKSAPITDPLYGISGSGSSVAPPTPPARNPRTHKVLKGESLFQIARNFDTTPRALADFNGLADVHRIRVGQELRLPEPSSASEKSSAPAVIRSTHIVRAGETLYRIALNHRVALDDLLAANPGIDAHSLSVGQEVRISQTTVRVQPADSDKEDSASKWREDAIELADTTG